ncbi:MAG: TIGR00725 family protein [Actinomycetota bacterium]|nr:TIGR00725 family protein [Actinomycetota bacterium]
MAERPVHVAVSGGGEAGEETCLLAEQVGRELARRGAVVLTGGLGGVMAAASRGAKAEHGTTVAILPGDDRDDANPWVDVALPTGMGEGRNVLLVRAADAVIAVAGGFGTLSEIALALRLGKPVIGLGTWGLVRDGEPVHALVAAADPADAAGKAVALATERRVRPTGS